MKQLWLVAAAVVVLAASAREAESVERATVATIQEISAHAVWVPDRLLRHSLLFDGDTGKVLGILDGGSNMTPKPPLLSRTRGELYSADIAYARGSRGERSDFLSIYDARTLDYLDEVVIPTRIGESNSSYAYAELLGERFAAVFNQFPNTSVSIIDLEQRAFVEEIAITGCSGIYPLGAQSFGTLCGNGTALRVDLDASGRKSSLSPSERFFDVVADPVAMPAGWDGSHWVWVSFAGQVHRVDFSSAKPSVRPAWSLVDDSERKAGWRPGGLQHVAVHAGTGRLFVVMHQGKPGSHKSPGPEIWVYDLEKQERIDRIEPPNLTAAFLAPLVGVAPDSFTFRMLAWVVPSPGVHTIAVTSDDTPLLFARSAEMGAVAVIDALSGETVRVLTEAGLAGPTLRVP